MNEFLDKLWSMEFGIALLGALVGGGFTLLGSWFQTKSANKATALAQAQANAQRGFDTLTQLKVHLEAQTFQGMGTAETRDAWNRERQTLITTTHSAVMLLPDAYKETRDPVLVLLPMMKEWYGLPPWPEYTVETSVVLAEALKFLGTFVRGSDVPERQALNPVIAKELNQYRRQQAQHELESLERDAERSGLDEEDMQRARDLREFLGLPHPPQPSAGDDGTPS
ncbi:hypothetical protein O1Q96_01435 (plasmid) [Streptomyces sp. Qhu-G9]|uniref:hypothetical protein n=1 Tax=Streptomyces sp. Qhu-G9 TaxID=3452799 RepID=UPI0022AC0283|nr:hypothetical protein [Streptomyces aurantiacus]WAU78517.1 hypothetical protein O1Q96_01435 [Streptomyces aurantiacus]